MITVPQLCWDFTEKSIWKSFLSFLFFFLVVGNTNYQLLCGSLSLCRVGISFTLGAYVRFWIHVNEAWWLTRHNTLMQAFHKSYLLKLRVAPSETAMTDVLREVPYWLLIVHCSPKSILSLRACIYICIIVSDHFIWLKSFVCI